jgi:predicted deacylase
MLRAMTNEHATPGPYLKSIAYEALAPGTRLAILGAVHGNETCGTFAIQRVVREIDDGKIGIRAGSVTFVPVTNPLAFSRRERAGDRNLNRNLFPREDPADFEDRIANRLCPLLARHDALLDLHSTRGKTEPFALVGPLDNDGPVQPFKRSREERALAKRLGVRRFVQGWLDTYARGVERRVREGGGTPTNSDPSYGVGTTEYMRSAGGYAITLECGQHEDPASVEVAYRAIRNTLAYLGIADDAPPPEVAQYEALRIRDVVDRAHADDRFAREWASFDALAKGDLIARRASGEALQAPADGRILFPDVGAKPGNEWYYLAETIPSL